MISPDRVTEWDHYIFLPSLRSVSSGIPLDDSIWVSGFLSSSREMTADKDRLLVSPVRKRRGGDSNTVLLVDSSPQLPSSTWESSRVPMPLPFFPREKCRLALSTATEVVLNFEESKGDNRGREVKLLNNDIPRRSMLFDAHRPNNIRFHPHPIPVSRL